MWFPPVPSLGKRLLKILKKHFWGKLWLLALKRGQVQTGSPHSQWQWLLAFSDCWVQDIKLGKFGCYLAYGQAHHEWSIPHCHLRLLALFLMAWQRALSGQSSGYNLGGPQLFCWRKYIMLNAFLKSICKRMLRKKGPEKCSLGLPGILSCLCVPFQLPSWVCLDRGVCIHGKVGCRGGGHSGLGKAVAGACVTSWTKGSWVLLCVRIDYLTILASWYVSWKYLVKESCKSSTKVAKHWLLLFSKSSIKQEQTKFADL